MWFKAESTGKAVTVKIAENANVLELMEAIIQQHSTFFSGQSDTLLWDLYKTGAEGKEPEDSWTTIAELDGAGETGPTALVLRRVSLPKLQGFAVKFNGRAQAQSC